MLSTRKQIHLFILTLLAFIMLGGYIVLVTVFNYKKDEQILTALITFAMMAFSFWFGTTASGQNKDHLIASMTPPPPPGTSIASTTVSTTPARGPGSDYDIGLQAAKTGGSLPDNPSDEMRAGYDAGKAAP